MKWLTATSCLAVIMLGALVAPTMTNKLESADLEEKLMRHLLEDNENLEDRSVAASGASGANQFPDWLGDCRSGELNSPVFCQLLEEVSSVGAEREPCIHAALEPNVSDGEIENCRLRIETALDLALHVPGEAEYFAIMKRVRWDMESLAKVLGIITPLQWVQVVGVETGVIRVQASPSSSS